MTENTTPPVDDKPTGNFWGWLREHKQGALHSELSEKLAELALACLEHEKAGSLTLTINVRDSGDGSTVFVSDDLKAKIPTADRGGSIMFASDDGTLSRQDPRQMTLPMKVVETDAGEPVVLDTATGEVRSI